MSADAVHVVCLAVHARDVALDDRVRFHELVVSSSSGSAVVLATCHRVDVYLSPGADATRLGACLPAGGQVRADAAAARHALLTAVGLDSAVLGEDQVLHQLRRGVADARSAGRLPAALERLFAIALREGRRARSWSGGERSLAGPALDAVERRAGALAGRSVVIVGAGRMATQAAVAARARGARVTVADRTPDHAARLARHVGAEAVPFDPGELLSGAAAVVIALAGPWPLSGHSADRLAANRAVTVVDLSVPRALDEGLRARLGERSVDADALARPAVGDDASTRLRARLERLVDEGLREYIDWLDRRAAATAVREIAERADREREAALRSLWERLPDLAGPQREAIEGMSRHLAERLLREPLSRLSRDPDDRLEAAARDLFGV